METILNNNSHQETFKIIPFDIVQIIQTPEVVQLTEQPKNRLLEEFRRIDQLPFNNVDIKFSSDIWDFSSISDLPGRKSKLKFDFSDLSTFRDIAKMYVLNDILKQATKISTLKSKSLIIKRILKFIETEGYVDIKYVPKHVYIKFYKEYEQKAGYNTISAYKGTNYLFLQFYERNFEELNDRSILKYLEERDTSKINLIKENNKTPEVPTDYLPVLIEGYKKIMRDETESIDDRITAAAVILYTQIGFRTGELFTVKTGAIEYSYSPTKEKPLRYMNFLSYKHGKTDTDATSAHTFITDLAFEAYENLEKWCEPYRKAIGSDALYVGRFQKNKYGDAQIFSTRFNLFTLNHWKDLKCINIGDQYEGLNSKRVGDMFVKDSRGGWNLDWNSPKYEGLSKDDYFFYPTIRQFRVSVCTNLYRQHIPLYYIKKHMNHLSEDMATYYIRPRAKLQKEFSETVYKAVFVDGSKLLGQNADQFIEKVNKHIDSIAENNPHIKENMDEIIKEASYRYPLRMKTGGVCIRCGEVIPCANNDISDEIYCAFGMCPNHCHMFFMADISYDEYLQHKNIIEYNETNGFVKAKQKEINKIKYVVKNSLLPELVELKNEVETKGKDNILAKYPQLEYMIAHYDEIYEEVSKWK